jgi:hypothetical protein
MLSRSAIQTSGIVVCERNFQAKSTFLGSPLRRALRSASLQPIRFSPSTTNRSANEALALIAPLDKLRVARRRLLDYQVDK